MKETDIPTLIETDGQMMAVLRAVRSLQLPDWWIGAGFVRNKIWDVLHGQERTPPGDIDVVYFEPADLSPDKEIEYQNQLEKILPTGKWSVTNQARMHMENGDTPYASSLDAIGHWPETATAVAITLDNSDRVIFKATHGTDDLLKLIVRPTPTFKNRTEKYRDRVRKKNWQAKWPKLKIEGLS